MFHVSLRPVVLAAAAAVAAAEPSATTLSRASLLAVGGGPAVMDWEGSTQQGSEEGEGGFLDPTPAAIYAQLSLNRFDCQPSLFTAP